MSIRFKCAECGMNLKEGGVCPKCGGHRFIKVIRRTEPFTPVKTLERIDEKPN